MPNCALKNLLYGLALPLVGLRSPWPNDEAAHPTLPKELFAALKRNHVVGGCIQTFRRGQLAECYTFGNRSLSPGTSVDSSTVFRTASIAKMVTALLVMRLQTLGKLDVDEDISRFWHTPIRNPFAADCPIPLSSLLNHTSGIVDSPAYFSAFTSDATVDDIFRDGACFASREPSQRFQYSNFAAGLIGCLLESRFGLSLEALMQTELFEPLGVAATFDASKLTADASNSYRVLPASHSPAFDAAKRAASARPLDQANPQRHFLLASGNLYLTAKDLALLTLAILQSAFIDERSRRLMLEPTVQWPHQEVRMRHGMGLLELEDRAVFARRLHGHQGFAYGAVNGVFFDDDGNGFVSLNSGASERRVGHLSRLNRDLISAMGRIGVIA